MENTFLINGTERVTYEQLVNDLNEKIDYTPYIYIEGNEPYYIFLNLIHSLVYDYPVELLDGDFSEAELKNLNIDKVRLYEKYSLKNSLMFQSVDDILEKINDNKKWTLSLYTSGTTGIPKKVSHTAKQLTRHIKQGHRFKDDVWGLAYNPTHMAGLQVFFQAFLNKNTLVYLFNKLFDQIDEIIKTTKVTSISATATFYRNIAPYIKESVFPYVKRLTFGGEKYDASLEIILRNSFPNAKIRNIYATTEAGSLFTAKGDLFKISDENKAFIKINSHNQLLLHKHLIGDSHDTVFEGDWFNTGDVVTKIDDVHFKFVSRQSDLIHIGGYKVNPLEVEELIKEVSGVKDVLVKSRVNSVTGELVVADIVIDESANKKEMRKIIKQHTSEHLQEWKIPRIIKFVDEIELTRTGKKVRK